MATKPIFRVVDVPSDATAQEMENLLNTPTDEGYTLHSISYAWQNIGARIVFKIPARRVNGEWVRDTE